MYIPKPTLKQIADAAARERQYQQAMHGEGANTQPVAGWLLIIEKEVQEAKQAWVGGVGPAPADTLRELLQVYATLQACFQQYGLVERVFPPHMEITAP